MSLSDLVGQRSANASSKAGRADITTGAPTAEAEAKQAKPKAILVYVTPRDHTRLRQLVLDEGRSMQKLGHEALNLLLANYGLEELEPMTANVPSGRKTK